MQLRRVCVFCGSSPGARPAYAAAARALGEALVARGLGLVYGGAQRGLMGIVADTVLAGGGEVIGVIPQGLVDREIAHRGLTELLVVQSMHERKAQMADRADAFIALPGGIGTFEEFFEVLSWSILGLHPKPCALLDVEGYYRPLVAMIDHGVAEGFVPERARGLVLEDDDAPTLLARLAAYEPPPSKAWVRPGER